MIVTEAVESYLAASRPEPDPLLAEMEAHGARDSIPIVVPETGILLQILALTHGARRIVEVGTAIGVSTLYLARALPPDGSIVSFEIDPRRHADASQYLERAGLAKRADLRLQDAREGLEGLDAPFDMAFIDGVKTQYSDYLDALIPLLGPRALLAVDNVLLSGTVAEGRGNEYWTDERVADARAFNQRLLDDERFVATVTPVGDGVLLALRTDGAGE
jgi:predicted O-methyltransferase YrrM